MKSTNHDIYKNQQLTKAGVAEDCQKTSLVVCLHDRGDLGSQHNSDVGSLYSRDR